MCSVAPKWMYIINRRRAKLEQMSTKDLTSNERFDLAYYMPSRAVSASGALAPSTASAPAPSPRCRDRSGLAATLLAALILLCLCAGRATPARAQGSAATDRAALVALYDATGGANWTNNTNWSTTAALSAWHGVQTDANGRVTHVDLYQNGLSGAIPAELGDLANLEELELDNNSLSGTIPGTFLGLSQLLFLDIRSTNLCAPPHSPTGSPPQA